LPATQNLRLRWRQTANNMSFYIDDILLRNPWSSPEISPAGPVNIIAGTSTTLTSSAADQYSWSGPGITPGTATSQFLTVTQPGCYTVTVWDVNNCMKTSSQVCVTQTPGLTPVAASNSPVCQNDTLLLSASGDASFVYTWTGPGIAAAGQVGQNI